MIKYFVLFLFVFGQSVSSFGQITEVPIAPLSPNDAEFAKYGSYPINYMTGVPQISIPVYEINTGSLKYHPITILRTTSSNTFSILDDDGNIFLSKSKCTIVMRIQTH